MTKVRYRAARAAKNLIVCLAVRTKCEKSVFLGQPQACHLWQGLVLLIVLDMTKLMVDCVQVLEAGERGLTTKRFRSKMINILVQHPSINIENC